ncbi:MAG: uroporphyrinogen decarboxylase family protein [Bacteroidota bacterium]|nr:uroporphyrinogen decarboxylase family protein [Bacteroidota bacterium]
MTSRQRLLCALERRVPDRLPVTTHHLMPSFLETLPGKPTPLEFFDRFGLDAVCWLNVNAPDPGCGQYFDPDHTPGEYEARRIVTECWRIEAEDVPDRWYRTVRYAIHTPRATLTTVLQSDAYTTWVAERLVKNKSDIDVIAEYMPPLVCDVEAVNRRAASFGERGIVRGTVPGFDVYGQPGCWQDAAVLVGIERLILSVYDDPDWVRRLLAVLEKRKRTWVSSLAGARYDLIELGGGDASSTVISPGIFEEFVAPYDASLIEEAHKAGMRVVYHICGGIMPLLDLLVAMKPDALETFTPSAMGGDADLGAAKKKIGGAVCMIGGFDQVHFFTGVDPERTRAEVRRCFEEAGEGGGYILAPSDHFFEAEIPLLEAYADEARACVYHPAGEG